MFWIMKFVTWIPFVILFPCKIMGKKNIPKGKAIIVSNHKSNFDYIYIFTKVWRKQYVLSKESLYKNWFVRWFFRSCCGIPVNRDNVSLSTIKECLGVLKKEKILTIFPEGTRNKTEEPLLEFKAGASVFAVKSNSPVVPMYIIKRGRIFKRNVIVVGEPIYFDNSYKGESGTIKANEVIKQKMLELKEGYDKVKNKDKNRV